MEYTDPEEVAVCNLGSVVLPKFVSEDGRSFDHQRLFEVRTKAYGGGGGQGKFLVESPYPASIGGTLT